MITPRQERCEREERQPVHEWTLGAAAPEWLRRIWGERIREVPTGPKQDLSRIRRIAYL